MSVLVFVLLVFTGCLAPANHDRPNEPLVLFGPVRSYDSPSTVRYALRPAAWVVMETQTIPKRTAGEGYEIQAVSLGEGMHRGVRGEVRLEFHNRKLSKVWFAPSQPDQYFEGTHIAAPRIGHAPAETHEGNLLTQVGIGADGRPYIFWQDLRTVSEHVAFMRKHHL